MLNQRFRIIIPNSTVYDISDYNIKEGGFLTFILSNDEFCDADIQQ
jgi:hypothetical protein